MLLARGQAGLEQRPVRLYSLRQKVCTLVLVRVLGLEGAVGVVYYLPDDVVALHLLMGDLI